jgi:hypothetical protein
MGDDLLRDALGGLENCPAQVRRGRFEVAAADQAGDFVEAIEDVAARGAGIEVRAELGRLRFVARVQGECGQRLAGVVVVHDL